MASHPYISGPNNVEQMLGLLRKNFPATVTSETVKKFSLAPNNESYVINALQFVGLIDENGKRTSKGHDVFVLDDTEFPRAFSQMIQDAYKDLFDIRGDEAWNLTKPQLTSYFRTADKTSEVIGGRQASVFQVFSRFAGHSNQPHEASTPKQPRAKRKVTNARADINGSKKTIAATSLPGSNTKGSLDQGQHRKDMALTVRVEINLPTNGSQETYDNIFKSIKANLLNE